MSLLIGSMLRGISWFAGFALRWYWTETRLATRIRTTIPGDRQAIRINGGELPEVALWLDIQNLGYFPVELDRLYGEIFCGARIASFIYIEHKMIEPLATETVYVHVDMTDAQARYLAITQEKRVRLTVNGYFNCRVQGFKIFGRNIESSNVEFINIQKSPRAA